MRRCSHHWRYGNGRPLQMIAATSALCQNNARPAKASSEVEHCQGAKEANKDAPRMNVRRRVAERKEILRRRNPLSNSPLKLERGRAARTRNPGGRARRDPSMTKLLDGDDDQDVTGLMLRCSEGATVDVLVVLIAPLPLRTHPKVTVVAGPTRRFHCQRGSARSFGAKRFGAAAGEVFPRWWSRCSQSVPELEVTIVEPHRSLRGRIRSLIFSTAMHTLQSNCSQSAFMPANRCIVSLTSFAVRKDR